MSDKRVMVRVTTPADNRIVWPRLGDPCRVAVGDRAGHNVVSWLDLRLADVVHRQDGAEEYVFVQQGARNEP